MTRPSREPDVGGRIEEALRRYFLAAGYFVVRGIKLTYDAQDVTDLDLWLYLRQSAVARERVNVDAKYKQSPKALERVLWAKGVQTILALDRCIVATTDRRPSIKRFGEEHAVLVLDGHFLARIAEEASPNHRLSDEGIWDLIGPKGDDRATAWKRRLNEARSRLVTQLSYDGCNLWLDDAAYFMDAAMTSDRRSAAYRLTYLMLAYFLVSLDYSTRNVVFEDAATRRNAIEAGLRYGSSGKDQIDRDLRLASDLIERYAPEARSVGHLVRRKALAEIDALPVGPVADFFAKADVATDLFVMARELEDAAFSKELPEPGALTAKVQGCIGIMLDLHNIERTEFYERF